MGVTFSIDTSDRIVYLSTSGESSSDDWGPAFLIILSDPYCDGFNFLSDYRQQADSPLEHFAGSVNTFLNLGFRETAGFRWACAVSEGVVKGVQPLYSGHAARAGIEMCVFSDFEEARQWLLLGRAE